jgi:hypothetical protein
MRQSKPIIRLERSENKSSLPFVGISASSEHKPLKNEVIESLKALSLDHYRIEVTPSKQQWVSDYSAEYQGAFTLNLPLFVALHLTGNYKVELDAFMTLSLQNRVRIKSILMFTENKPVTEQAVIDHVIRECKPLMPLVSWGAGTDYNFTDLNRNRFAPEGLDFISYSIHPQEHAFDDLSMIENIEGQTETAKSAGHLYPSMNVYVSPVTLRKRFNPAATDPSAQKLTEEQKSDPRQLAVFNARWTFGSLRALAEGRVHSATYFQTAGKQGLLSGDNETYPVYDLLLNLMAFRDKHVVLVTNSHPHLIDALLFEELDNDVLWLVNYSDVRQTVLFENRSIELNPGEIKTERSDRT